MKKKKIFTRVAAVATAAAVTVTAAAFDLPGKILMAAAGADHTSHKVCGDLSCSDSSHTDIADWTAISQDNISDLSKEGNYYLADDIILSNAADENEDSSRTAITIDGTNVTLCLNGHTISVNEGETARIFYIKRSGSLTLCDCSSGKTGTLTGGNVDNGSGGAVYVYGGSFTMYGGTISDNTASTDGGGVNVASNGTFEMKGGTISGNTASNGGGVCNNGIFTMSGNSTISSNNANSGGGVYNYGMFRVHSVVGETVTYKLTGGIFEMSGGTISDNTANNNDGGGVCFIGGAFTIDGKIDISGNTKDSSANNVFLNHGDDDPTIIKIGNSSEIIIGNSFDTDSKIGVNTKKTPDCTNFADVTVFADGVTAKDISASFTADIDGQSIVYNNDMVQLKGAHPAEKTEAVDATCTEDGNKEYWYCSVCEKYFSDENCTDEITEADTVIAKGHDIEHTEAKDPTCTEDGNKEYWYCSVCKKYFSDEDCTDEITEAATVTEATGHDTEHTEAKAATCTEAGNIEYWYCPDCESYFKDEACTEATTKDETVIKAAHTAVTDARVEPTCTDTGLTEGSHCQTCDTVLVKQEVIPALGHSWDDGVITTQPTETTAGVKTYTCTVCQSTKTEPMAMLGHTHDWDTEWSKDDTYHWHDCLNNCGEKKDEAAHTWDEGKITKEPTADEAGEKTFTCTVCGRTETEKVPAAGGESGNTDYSGSCGENLTWTYDPETKTLTITGTGDMTDWPDGSEAPWAEFADEIEKVVIEEGVTSIGDNAFKDCTSLTEAEIPDTVTEIGNSAFEGCESLTEIEIPENVETIGENAFKGCTALAVVTFKGEEPPTLGNGVFDGCDNLKNIYVPKDFLKDYADALEDFVNNTAILPDTSGEPDDPDKTNISQEVQSGENAPEAKLETPLDELIKAVLTPEEQELIENGEIKVTILLTIDDGTYSVSAEDKEKTEAIMAEEDLKPGQYLDVKLYKVIDGVKEEITETNELITITFEIPEALRGEGRTYWLIRVHNGETFVIADQDDNADTVTIKTGKFSTYALVYSEKTTDTPPAIGGSTGGGNFTVPDLGGSGSGTPAASETTPVDNGTPAASEDNTANGGTPAASENSTSNGGTPAASENNTANGENTAPANSVTCNGENGTNSDESTDANGSETNPATGIAISLIPLAAITVIAAAATKRKKK